MKSAVLVLLISMLNVLIMPAYSQERKISLDLRNATLEEVFAEIEKQHDVVFIYRQELIDNASKVSVFCKDANLKEILKDILVTRNLDFTERGRQIIITPVASKEEDAEEFKISGKITDVKGGPMPGAAILIKGTMKGSISDNDGNYIIIAPPNGTLVYSFLGCCPQEVPIMGRSVINIVMEEEAAELLGAELVVTGYQTISKERSAGLYAKPDMDVLVSRPGVPNILQRLDGLVAGLTVNNAPSASQNSFLIRGLSTIGIFDNQISNSVPTGTNRNPLYVVDGVPIEDINTVNPQDVSDISILKDATASSIWGARASNGVIVITTKKGGVNEKINLEYNGYVSFQGHPDLDYIPALDSRQFISAANDVFSLQNSDNPQKYAELYPWSTISEYRSIANTGIAPHEVILYDGYLGKTSPQQTQARLDSLSQINNRGQIRDLWYRDAMLTNHTLSASGGGNIHSFYGSFTFTNTTGNRPQDSDNHFKINLRQDFRFSDRFKVYLITDLSNSLSNSKRNIAVNNKFYPYQLFRDQAGNNLSIPYMRYLSEPVRQQFQDMSGINLDYNPLDEVNRGYTKSEDIHNRVVGGISLDILKGLRFEGTYGYIKGISETKSFDDETSYLVRSELVQFTIAPQTPGGTPQYGLPENGGRYSVTNMSQTSWTVRNQLVYNMHWNDMVHQLTLLAGHEMQEQLMIYKSNTVRGYDPLLLTFTPVDYKTLSSDGMTGTIMPNNGTRSTLMNDSFNTSESLVRFRSYYANAAYTFSHKYTLNTSLRTDGSNLFGIDKSAQNKPVWSVGAKWRLGSEEFLSATNWIDDLSLRVTYGITGNAPHPGTASSYDILSAVSGSSMPGGKGLTIATAANPKLTWESTSTVNAGVDFTLLNRRITGSIDVYKKKTDNLLGQLPTNSLTGFSNIIGNLGTIENKGLEITLGTVNVQSNDFYWNTHLAMAYNQNKILTINNLTPLTTGAQQIQQKYVEGYSAFSLFAYRYAGLNEKGDPQIYLNDNTVTSMRNITDTEDAVFMGTYQPVWSGGITNVFGYKGFRLTVNCIFNLGHFMRRDVNQYYSGRLTHNNMATGGFTTGNLHEEFMDRWTKPGDETNTDIPSYVVNQSSSDTRRDINYYRYADINVISASYVKMRDISLSYILPQKLTKNTLIEVRTQVGNIMLWKANKNNIDPEFHDAFTGLRAVPTQQGNVTFGVNVKF